MRQGVRGRCHCGVSEVTGAQGPQGHAARPSQWPHRALPLGTLQPHPGSSAPSVTLSRHLPGPCLCPRSLRATTLGLSSDAATAPGGRGCLETSHQVRSGPLWASVLRAPRHLEGYPLCQGCPGLGFLPHGMSSLVSDSGSNPTPKHSVSDATYEWGPWRASELDQGSSGSRTTAKGHALGKGHGDEAEATTCQHQGDGRIMECPATGLPLGTKGTSHHIQGQGHCARVLGPPPQLGA